MNVEPTPAQVALRERVVRFARGLETQAAQHDQSTVVDRGPAGLRRVRRARPAHPQTVRRRWPRPAHHHDRLRGTPRTTTVIGSSAGDRASSRGGGVVLHGGGRGHGPDGE